MPHEENKNKEIEKLLSMKNVDSVVHIKDATIRNGEYTTPYSIGYSVFDDALKGGVREGDLIIGTGLSGHGKTMFFLNISANLSDTKNSCLWFSYEVIVDNLYAKFKEMGYDKDGFLIYTPKQLTSGNVEWIHKKILEAKDKYDVKFVFIDHIDFLSPKKIRSSDQLRMILGAIATELKQIAIGLKIAIFLIAHVKKVQGRAIEMQDISEGSGIYKIADSIFCVQRNSEIVDIGGKKTEVFVDGGNIRILKNRITGEYPFMNFRLENNIIVPLGLKSIETEGENTINVSIEQKQKPKPLFGQID
jgi:archaellum biogenesis ATPase FlaH